jgi:hypothetical protein
VDINKEREELLRRKIASILSDYRYSQSLFDDVAFLEKDVRNAFSKYGFDDVKWNVGIYKSGFRFTPATDDEDKKEFLKRIFGGK